MRAAAITLGLLTAAILGGWPTPAPGAAESVLGTITDFENEPVGFKGSINPWFWPPEQRQNATNYSRFEIVADPGAGLKYYRVSLSPALPWDQAGTPVDFYRVLDTKLDYLSPASDVVRLKVKVLSGQFRLNVSASTAYFGNSDVFCQPQLLTASTNGDWRHLDFSLQAPLTRNYRRAGFSQHSPVIYLGRWIQEGLAIDVLPGSQGVLVIDKIELLTRGQGQRLPVFSAGQITNVATVADFEMGEEMTKSFTFTHAETVLTGEPVLPRPTWAPPHLTRVGEGLDGNLSLEVRQTGYEEVAFTGIHALGPAGANAIRLKIRADHPLPIPAISLDFLAYVAPPAARAAFPWTRLEPPASWRNAPDIAFTYYLSQQNTVGLSYGFYHARRALPRGQWQTLIIPLADFMCAYGQGDCAPWFQQQALLSSDRILALGFLSSFRQRLGETRILVDEVAFVSVPEGSVPLRSFWQQPRAGVKPVSILNGVLQGSGFELAFATEPGVLYGVERNPGLNPGSWQRLSTVTGDGSIARARDDSPDPWQHFYRVVSE